MNSTDIHIDNATAGQNTGITLDTSGNVGIGTSSPSEKLSVAGIVTMGGLQSTYSQKSFWVSPARDPFVWPLIPSLSER